MSPRRVSFLCVWTLIAAVAGCKKSNGVMCDSPVDPTCPEAGPPPSFAEVYQKVFVPYCVSCHNADGGVESKTPLTTYAQIYGQNGTEAVQIITQVFRNCAMPPSNADAQLSEGNADGGDGGLGPRQMLFEWLGCGAKNTDAGSTER